MYEMIAHPQELESAVRQWLADHGMVEDYRLANGFRIYTQAGWKAKGETICPSAALTVISEGELYQLWNQDPCCDEEPLHSLSEAAEQLGYYPELGYGWSMHFHAMDS